MPAELLSARNCWQRFNRTGAQPDHLIWLHVLFLVFVYCSCSRDSRLIIAAARNHQEIIISHSKRKSSLMLLLSRLFHRTVGSAGIQPALNHKTRPQVNSFVAIGRFFGPNVRAIQAGKAPWSHFGPDCLLNQRAPAASAGSRKGGTSGGEKTVEKGWGRPARPRKRRIPQRRAGVGRHTSSPWRKSVSGPGAARGR